MKESWQGGATEEKPGNKLEKFWFDEEKLSNIANSYFDGDLEKVKEEYEKYLEGLFPDSLVKDIVYHSSKRCIEGEVRTISNWTPRSTSRMKIEQEYSKGFYVTRNKEYIKKLHGISSIIHNIRINIQTPKIINGIVNSNAIEISKVEVLENQGYDSIISDEGGEENTIIIFDPKNILILGSDIDINNFESVLKRKEI